MALQELKDYVVSGKADFHDGLDSMIISQGTLIGLKHALFFIPTSSVQVFVNFRGGDVFQGAQTDINLGNTKQVQSFLRSFEGTVLDLEQILMSYLDGISFRYRIDIITLEWFEVKTGFFTGGLFMRRVGEFRKVVNLRGKAAKRRFKEFYRDIERMQ